jgi:hypothetical protein
MIKFIEKACLTRKKAIFFDEYIKKIVRLKYTVDERQLIALKVALYGGGVSIIL